MTLRDDFNRADGALGSNWSSSGGSATYTIISNTAASSNLEVEEAVWWNPISFANDHFAEVTVTTVASNAFIGPAVRVSSGGNYYGFYGDNSNRYLISVVGGTWTSLATLGTGFSNGDVLRLEVEGTTLRAYINSVLWTSVTNSSLSSGSAGLTSWANNTSGRLDDFTAADLAGAVTVNVSLAAGNGIALPAVPAPGNLNAGTGLAIARGIALPVVPDVFPPQLVRPVSDVSVGAWTTEIGGTSNLYASIDETTANDTDYVRSEVSPSASVYRVRLSPITDPGVLAGRLLRYRIGVDGSGSMDWVVRVFNASTEVVSWTHSSISTLTTFEQTLSEAQAAALDNSAIDVEWEATQV